MLNQETHNQHKKNIRQNPVKGWHSSKALVLPLKTSGNGALPTEIVVERMGFEKALYCSGKGLLKERKSRVQETKKLCSNQPI